nr:hypothetical protein [Tanacetum cinerariifolium]
MIPDTVHPDREVPVAITFHEQTNDELTNNKVKQMKTNDQAIQTILMRLLEDIYVAVDSCETAQEIWNQVVQNAVQNPDIQNVRNQNGLIVVSRITNQNANKNRNGNVVAAQAKGNGNGNNGNQQASKSGAQTKKALVYDSDGSAE